MSDACISRVTVHGFVAHDLELRYEPDDDYARPAAYLALVDFDLLPAKPGPTSLPAPAPLVRVTATGTLADNAAASLRAGDAVMVSGHMTLHDGAAHVLASDVGVSLRHAITQPHRTTYEQVAAVIPIAGAR